MSPEIFISYSREDFDKVKPIIDALEINGIYPSQFFFDKQNIFGATNIAKEISQAILDCKVLIFFISKNAVNSLWVNREVYFALDRNKHVLPLQLEPADLPSQLQLLLAGINHLNLYSQDEKYVVRDILKSLDNIGVKIDKDTHHFLIYIIYQRMILINF